jgi:hypothetical protein
VSKKKGSISWRRKECVSQFSPSYPFLSRLTNNPLAATPPALPRAANLLNPLLRLQTCLPAARPPEPNVQGTKCRMSLLLPRVLGSAVPLPTASQAVLTKRGDARRGDCRRTTSTNRRLRNASVNSLEASRRSRHNCSRALPLHTTLAPSCLFSFCVVLSWQLSFHNTRPFCLAEAYHERAR